MIHAILLILAIVLWANYSYIRLHHSLHMLQLNSYRNERFMRWVLLHPGQWFRLREWLPIIAFIMFNWTMSESAALLAWMASYVFLSLLRPKVQHKKPLVVTLRVRRLLATIVIVMVIVIILTCFIPIEVQLPILFILTLVPFLVVLAANIINAPIEGWIRKRYLNEAKALIESAQKLRRIGITGSFGKTSVKHFLHTVLNQHFPTLMTPESYNTPMGVTKTIREQLRATHEIFIAEMGAKQIGDIKELCDLVSPQYGIITSIGEQHLETFKSLENIKATKFELAQSLTQQGVLFTNKDDANIAAQLRSLPLTCKVVTYGIDSEHVDVRASDISFSAQGTSFTVNRTGKQPFHCQTTLLGKHNVYNVLACIAVALELGVPADELTQTLKKIKPVKHRLELKRQTGNITFIDDSFNSNPVGAAAALDVLEQMDGLRVIVTPGIVELGEKAYAYNHALGMHAAQVCDYIVLVGEKQTKPLQDALVEASYPKTQYYVAKNLNDALQQLREVSTMHMFVLLENDLPDNYNE